MTAGLALGSLPFAALAAPPATPPRPAEQANIDLVTRFCQAWGSRDVEQLIPFVAETLEYHVNEGGQVITSASGLRTAMGPFMSGMATINWEIFRSAALGDIVINDRIDHFIRPPNAGKPDFHFAVTGVFLVRDGKIQYWADYRSPEKKA
jgi:limonene-1,2-epoxide hydrolase